MDIKLLQKKTSQAKRALVRVKTYLSPTEKKFVEDYLSQDVTYRNFVIAVQNCVDMGSHIISEEGWPNPGTMKEIFQTLDGQNIISSSLAKNLIKTVTVRNIIVHDYAKLDHRKAYRLIKQSLRFIPQFCLDILNFIKKK